MNEKLASPLLIVGSGAMACLFAARLSAAGIPVAMLGSWPEGMQALLTNGVRLVNPDGTEQAYPVQAVGSLEACQAAHYALVMVKSWQTERVARQLAGCLAGDGLAVTLQNGLGNRETLARSLGKAHVALGVTTTGATLLGPGRVRPAGNGLVSLNGDPRLQPLGELLRQAGFEVESVPDANTLLWSKLVINAAINPLTALLEVPNGKLLESAFGRQLMSVVAQEAAAVAVAKGIQLPYPDPVAAAEAVAQRTANNHSSMLQDILRGAPTEIDAICGAIVQAGEQAGVPTPVNRTLLLLIKLKQSAYQKPGIEFS